MGLGTVLGGTGGGSCVLTALVRLILVQKESLTRSSLTWGEGSISGSHFQLMNQPLRPPPSQLMTARSPRPQADAFRFLFALPDAQDLRGLVSRLSAWTLESEVRLSVQMPVASLELCGLGCVIEPASSLQSGRQRRCKGQGSTELTPMKCPEQCLALRVPGCRQLGPSCGPRFAQLFADP